MRPARPQPRGGRGDSSGDASLPVNAPPAAAPAGASASRGRPGMTRPAAAPGRGKFRPIARRRTEADRERLAQEEEEKTRRRLEDDAIIRGLERGRSSTRGRGRGRGSRARGGLIRGGRGGLGSLSQGFYSTPTTRGGGGGAGGSYRTIQGGSGGASAVPLSTQAAARLYGEATGYGQGGYNADTLYNIVRPAEEGGAVTTRESMMPLGIRRIEHQEESVLMKSAADIEAQEHSAGQDGGEIRDTSEDMSDRATMFANQSTDLSSPTSTEGTGDIAVKSEEPDATTLMDIDADVKPRDSANVKKNDEAHADDSDEKKAAAKVTEEDLLVEDLRKVFDLFSMQSGNTSEGPAGAGGRPLDGHMFLFQFPPQLPPLRSQAPVAPQNPVKSEPQEDDVVMRDPAPGGKRVQIDLTKGTKEAYGAAETSDSDDDAARPIWDLPDEGGFVGNLVLHKSGKVELDWGGMRLSLMPGIERNFLSTAVLLEDDDSKQQPAVAQSQGGEQTVGTAYGMGKIHGIFTLGAVWEDEEDWVVDPEQIHVAEGMMD